MRSDSPGSEDCTRYLQHGRGRALAGHLLLLGGAPMAPAAASGRHSRSRRGVDPRAPDLGVQGSRPLGGRRKRPERRAAGLYAPRYIEPDGHTPVDRPGLHADGRLRLQADERSRPAASHGAVGPRHKGQYARQRPAWRHLGRLSAGLLPRAERRAAGPRRDRRRRHDVRRRLHAFDLAPGRHGLCRLHRRRRARRAAAGPDAAAPLPVRPARGLHGRALHGIALDPSRVRRPAAERAPCARAGRGHRHAAARVRDVVVRLALVDRPERPAVQRGGPVRQSPGRGGRERVPRLRQPVRGR